MFESPIDVAEFLYGAIDNSKRTGVDITLNTEQAKKIADFMNTMSVMMDEQITNKKILNVVMELKNEIKGLSGSCAFGGSMYGSPSVMDIGGKQPKEDVTSDECLDKYNNEMESMVMDMTDDFDEDDLL